MNLAPDILNALRELSLREPDVLGRRRSFTIDRSRALSKLREASLPDWTWTLFLVRAAVQLDEKARATVSVEVEGENRRVHLRFDLRSPDRVDPTFFEDLLDAALEADHALNADQSFRHLIASAINGALAQDSPRSVELAFGDLFTKYTLRSAGSNRDGYRAVVAPSQPEDRAAIVMTIEHARPGTISRVGAWLGGDRGPLSDIAAIWNVGLVAPSPPVVESTAESLGPISLTGAMSAGLELGDYAHLWPQQRGLWLIRQGVRIVELSAALQGQIPATIHGLIDCRALRVTGTPMRVVHDNALDLLIAWLCEFESPPPAEGEDRTWKTASGLPVEREALERMQAESTMVPFAWRHALEAVPARDRALVLGLGPSAHGRLQRDFPALKLVHHSVLGARLSTPPIDLSELQATSLPAIKLVRGLDLVGEAELTVDVDLWIHRSPAASDGLTLVVACDRLVGHTRDPAVTIAGATLVCRIADETVPLQELRDDAALVHLISRNASRHARIHERELVALAMAHGNAWDLPYLHHALDALSAATLRLRYAASGPQGALTLVWDPHPLLALSVAERPGGGSQSIGDALVQLRDHGLLPATDPKARWENLPASPAELAPWTFRPQLRALIERIVGSLSFVVLPTSPETYLRPMAAKEQRHLVGARHDVIRDLERCPSDPRARFRLAGHLVVARILGLDTFGLETAALFSRYDPRALAPTRWVSLASIERADPKPGLVPIGAVSRALPSAVIEVTPGMAHLLGAHAGMLPAAGPDPISAKTGDDRVPAIRKHGRDPEPIVSLAIVDSLAVGALRIAADAESDGIEIWAAGLRTSDIALPEPFGRVSGRLWLTDAGRRASEKDIGLRLVAWCNAILLQARSSRVLVARGSAKRLRLDALLDYVDATTNNQSESVPPLSSQLTQAAVISNSATGEARLRAMLRAAVGPAILLDTAHFSWKTTKTEVRTDGRWQVTLGLRDGWIRRAFESQQDTGERQPLAEACVLILAEVARSAPELYPLHRILKSALDMS